MRDIFFLRLLLIHLLLKLTQILSLNALSKAFIGSTKAGYDLPPPGILLQTFQTVEIHKHEFCFRLLVTKLSPVHDFQQPFLWYFIQTFVKIHKHKIRFSPVLLQIPLLFKTFQTIFYRILSRTS